MNATERLRNAGQSIWLDNITRALLTSGDLEWYIREFSVTGLTSNPTILNHAIKSSHDYDGDIREKTAAAKNGETLLFELVIEDLRRAADLFRPIHELSNQVDGWVSLEVSPKLAHDAAGTIREAKALYASADRPNLFIKIPGTEEGISAIEEATFAGVPVNVTLLFSCEQYLASAEAYIHGIERRVANGLNPHVPSVASLFVSRWDAAVAGKVPTKFGDRLGIAVAKRTYKAYCELLASDRWLRLLNLGARSQRLLWASTGTKNPEASELLYVNSLVAPYTVNTMPEKTLLALAGRVDSGATLPRDGGDAEQMLEQFTKAGVDLDELAAKLQRDGADAFIKSWEELLACIADRSAALINAR